MPLLYGACRSCSFFYSDHYYRPPLFLHSNSGKSMSSQSVNIFLERKIFLSSMLCCVVMYISYIYIALPSLVKLCEENRGQIHMSELLNVKKLSESISVPAYTIREWAREGKIPAYKAGKSWLFDPEEVIAAIKALTSPVNSTTVRLRQNTRRALES